MAESEILKAIAGTGVGGLIAAFMFLLYRRDILEAQKREMAQAEAHKAAHQELAEAHKELAEKSIEVVVNNTRAMAQLESTNAQLSRAIEATNVQTARASRRQDREDSHGH